MLIPYHHLNLQSEEMIYYVSGKFGPRKGVEVGSDTFCPLKLTKFAKDLDDGKYAYSWYEEPDAPGTAEEDPAGVTSRL